jgi:hypothetical protein
MAMKAVLITATIMQKTLGPLHYFLLAVTAVLLVIYHLSTGWSHSVDLAHHYALAARLAENLQLFALDPTLGEMNYYPRASHGLAAIVGALVNSTFLGMQIVAMAALALTWAAYLVILQTLPGRASTIGTLILASLLYVNCNSLGISFHGAEISDNYFFSQLVGQSLAALSLVIVIHLEARHPRWYIYTFLCVSAALLCSVHLLPSLEVLAMLALLLIVDTVDAAKTTRWSWRNLVASGAVLSIAVAGVVLNPAFAAMRQIAENDGALKLAFLSGPTAICVLCLIALLISGLLLRSWWCGGRTDVACKYLALYGAGMALLCLLQLSLLPFHFGSDYAVKKYAFGISSFILVSIARAAGIAMAAQLDNALDGARLPGGFIVPTLAMVLALTVSFNYAAPWTKRLDNATIVKLERQILAMRDSTLPPAPAGKYDVIIDMAGQGSVVNYMFSIALAHIPRPVAGLALVDNNKLGDMDLYGSIISSRGFSRYSGRGCERQAFGPLVAFDPVCLKESLARSSMCNGLVDFSSKGQIDVNQLTGFSEAEPESRWTESPMATFRCNAAGATRAKMFVTPFLQGPQKSQRLILSVNDGPPVETVFSMPADGRSVELPLPALAPGTPMLFKLSMPDARTPKQLGIGDDGRALGMSVKSLSFE